MNLHVFPRSPAAIGRARQTTFKPLKVAFLAALISLSTALPSPAAAASNACQALFFPEQFSVPPVDLETQLATGYDNPTVVGAYRDLRSLELSHPNVTSGRRNGALLAAIKQILIDEELSVFHLRLQEVLAGTVRTMSAHPSALRDDLLFREIFAHELERVLRHELTESQVRERLHVLVSDHRVSKQTLMSAIGLRSASETLETLIGRSGPHEIDPTSLVGRYLKASADAGVNVASRIGAFPMGPDEVSHGSPRLFLSVDKKTASFATRLFGENAHLLAHNHSPHQAAVQLQHAGQAVAYAKYEIPYRLGDKVGSVVPILVLSTTEASRAKNYFDLGRATNSARAKYPWSFKDADGESYCRPGGYNSCSHWFGEMPIGDRLLAETTFPGQPDGFATQSDFEALDSRSLRTAPVGRIAIFDQAGRDVAIGHSSRVDRLTRLVWKESRSHEQLWSVLGLSKSLQEGEFANPGWTLYALAAKAPQSRVPIVLVYRDDASAPLSQNEIDQLRTTIQAY